MNHSLLNISFSQLSSYLPSPFKFGGGHQILDVEPLVLPSELAQSNIANSSFKKHSTPLVASQRDESFDYQKHQDELRIANPFEPPKTTLDEQQLRISDIVNPNSIFYANLTLFLGVEIYQSSIMKACVDVATNGSIDFAINPYDDYTHMACVAFLVLLSTQLISRVDKNPSHQWIANGIGLSTSIFLLLHHLI